MLQLLCALVGLFCAVYGTYSFSSDYTCRIVSFSKTLKKYCMNLFWIPSACCIVVVLGLAVMRSSSL